MQQQAVSAVAKLGDTGSPRHEEDAGSLIRDVRAVMSFLNISYVQRYCGAGAVELDVNHFRALSQQQGDADTECVIV